MEQTTKFEGKKRTYHSRVRHRQAEETRRRILEAARSQFERCGYAATTLEAIAEIAEVSPKTIAAVFGSKRALLAEVINPEAFSSSVRQFIEELRATEEVSRHLSLVAQITRQTYEPLASSLELLRTGGAVAPELAEVEARRRQNQARLIASLREQGALRPGLELQEATDVLWALTSYDLYRQLHRAFFALCLLLAPLTVSLWFGLCPEYGNPACPVGTGTTLAAFRAANPLLLQLFFVLAFISVYIYPLSYIGLGRLALKRPPWLSSMGMALGFVGSVVWSLLMGESFWVNAPFFLLGRPTSQTGPFLPCTAAGSLDTCSAMCCWASRCCEHE